MKACARSTPAGPCAKARGHRAGPCMDLLAYTDHLLAERRTILCTAGIVERVIFGQDMGGAVVVIGPDAQRASVMRTITDDVHAERSAFGQAVAECFAAAIPARPSNPRAPRSEAESLDLEDFMVAAMPHLLEHEAPIAAFEKHAAELRANAGAVMLMLDDVQGIALRGYAPALVRWLLDRSGEIPLVMGTSEDGWKIFRGYVEAIGLTQSLARVYAVGLDLP